MANIPKEHEKLYFDVLCRTQKLETVLSLIYATYQAKKSGVSDIRAEIAKRLENAYNLFKTNIRGTDCGSGTYAGTMKQFESQYTIGHELCIWANSNLDLTPYALAVAEGRMPIKEYFDIFFLSYFQPINGKAVHVLYLILKYMIDCKINDIDKSSIPLALGVEAEKEDINALCNFLSDTSYISYDGKKLSYVGNEPIESFIKRCNIQYLGVEGLKKAKLELNTDEKYIAYVMSGKLKIKDEIDQFSSLYSNFKHLLSWFIKQLNINNDLEEGTKTSGKGCDGDLIQSKYSEWRDYNTFTLDCSLQCGYLSVSNKVNYIHKTNTGINIRPNFEKTTKEVKSLSLDLYGYDLSSLDNETLKLLDKEYLIGDLSLFDDLEPNDKLKELFNDYVFIINKLSKNDETREVPVFDFNQCTELTQKGSNLVVYGTPGCGKSYYVEHTLLPESDYPIKADGTKERVIRTTFYQDYTNTDFVGQILPVIDGDKVTYKFNPGPFTLALIEAIKNPNKKVALVIEELNRGNAPSIFGDVFQLLDRKDGISEYSIVNVNLIRYLNEVFNSQYKFEFIKIPTNLSIYATMNTSDQNVFTLDTAFKRRWEFIKLANTFKLDHKFKDKFIPGDNITWQELVTAINEYILANSDGYNSEDKQMGVYFVDESGMTSSIVDHKDMNKEEAHKFAYKIMEYLWDDVAKFQRGKWFKDDINSLDKLIDEYMKSGVNGVFKNGVIKKYE